MTGRRKTGGSKQMAVLAQISSSESGESNKKDVVDVELLYSLSPISFSYLVGCIAGALHTTTVIHTVFVFRSNVNE